MTIEVDATGSSLFEEQKKPQTKVVKAQKYSIERIEQVKAYASKVKDKPKF